MKDIVNISKGKTEGEDKKNRKINKRKMILAISIGIIILIIGITMLIYYSSRDARKFLDQYLFRKNITQEKLDTIELDYNSNISIFAYNRYICVLAENKLMEYNSSGKLEHEISLEINNPVYSVNNKYVAISEKGGSKINLISDSNLLWSKDVDGNIIEEKILTTKFIKHLQNTDLYEMRISVGSNEYRTILFAINHNNIILSTQILVLNAFLKKSEKDYKKQIEIAETILGGYINDTF